MIVFQTLFLLQQKTDKIKILDKQEFFDAPDKEDHILNIFLDAGVVPIGEWKLFSPKENEILVIYNFNNLGKLKSIINYSLKLFTEFDENGNVRQEKVLQSKIVLFYFILDKFATSPHIITPPPTRKRNINKIFIMHDCKKRLVVLMLHLLVFTASAFSQTLTCSDIKNGVFISFSKTDGSRSVYTRNGEVQKELNTSTKETIFWDVEWIDDCSYYLKYNSGLEDNSKKELEKIKKHKILIKVLSVSQNYYLFQSFLDKESSTPVMKDTLWIKQRKDTKNKVTNNPAIDSILAVRKPLLMLH